MGYTLLLLFTLLLLLTLTIIRRIFFHPLSQYPGPFLGKFSDLPTIIAVAKKARTFHQHELLQKYGSPMRIGTNHLIFADADSYIAINGQSSNPCLKDPEFYHSMSVTGATNVFNATDRAEHARLRRLVSHSFSVKGLLESQEFIQDKIEQYVSIFRGAKDQPVDILHKTYELSLDIVSQLSFGESYDCLRGKNATAHDDVKAFFTVMPALGFAPVLRYLPIRRIKEGMKGLARLRNFSESNVGMYLSRKENTTNVDTEGKFLENLAAAVDAETGTSLTQAELVENAIIFLVAGSDTTAATMIYLIWECGRHPTVKQKLIAEIRARFPDPSVRPTYEEASQLKFLNCVIEEILRLRGPLNVGNLRISPGKLINNQFVPPGTKVEGATYSMARNPHVFHNPNTFDPSRWESPTDEMKRIWPFSYGPFNCVGRHLAEINLVLTVTRLYQLYDVVPSSALTAADMEQVDEGVLQPGCNSFCVTAKRHGET